MQMTIEMLQIKQDSSIEISDVILIIQGIKDIFIKSERTAVIGGKAIKLDNEQNFAKFSEKLKPWTNRTFLEKTKQANIAKL